jgi:O-6-methylguanine DNA methyltransferase
MRNNNSFYNIVYNTVRRIPKGKVATYGQIAALCGAPKASRVVGSALHRNPEPIAIPCHRVVNRFGGLAPAFAFGGQQVQKSLLESEGVRVNDAFTVDLSEYLWDGKQTDDEM